MQASIQVPVGATKGRFDASFYEAQAREIGAPLAWAQQAGSTVTAIESQRALAEATRVRAAADHAAALAEANRLLAGAMSAFEAQSAANRRMRDNAESGYTAAEREIAAQEAALRAEHEVALHVAQAQLEEATRRAEALREQAADRYAEAVAQHERMMADAHAYVDRTQATIEQIRESAGTTLARAEAEAKALRMRAQAQREIAAAHWETVEGQVVATREWAETRYSALMREASAVREQSIAQAENLRARADALTGWDLDERHAAALADAEAEYAKARSLVAMMRENTTSDLVAAAATFTTDRQNATARLEQHGQTYEAELARIASDLRVAEAQASIQMARAQELRHDAQARFVSEIATAMGGESHAERAEAFAAAQNWAESVSAGNTTNDAPRSLDLNDPELVASIHAFVNQLAESRSLEEFALAAREKNQSVANTRRSEIEVWWSESKAAVEAAIDGIGHAESSTIESMQQRLADAETLEAQAARAYEIAQRDAGAAQAVAETKRTELEREAEHVLLAGERRAEALMAQGDSAKAEGEEAVAQLGRSGQAARVEADAIAQGMESQALLLIAEAQSQVASLTAMADAAASSVTPEFDQRQAEAARVLDIAEAERTDALQSAETITRMAGAESAETLAALEARSGSFMRALEDTLREAMSARDSELAEAERVLSEATASYASFQARDVVRRAEAEAVEQALLSFADERHAVADAQDAAVFAEFSSRLATLQADRDRSYADAYFKAFLSQANMTPEDLRRYVAAADAALGRLQRASVGGTVGAIGSTANEASVPVPGEGVEVLRVESMSANGIATVPTDGDE